MDRVLTPEGHTQLPRVETGDTGQGRCERGELFPPIRRRVGRLDEQPRLARSQSFPHSDKTCYRETRTTRQAEDVDTTLHQQRRHAILEPLANDHVRLRSAGKNPLARRGSDYSPLCRDPQTPSRQFACNIWDNLALWINDEAQ